MADEAAVTDRGLAGARKASEARRIGAGENGILRRRATRKGEIWGMDFVEGPVDPC
jgi:hypothetical protein